VAEPSDACPLCNASVEPGQEYCLACGSRIARRPHLGRYPRDWIWATSLLLLVAAGSATAAILASRDTGATGGRTIVATSPVVAAPQAPPAAVPAPARSRGPTTTITISPPGPAPRPAPKVTTGLLEWPARNGYTVVLASIPARGDGLAAARTLAAAARKGGLRDVGVLVSARFASLHPGYYVVFAGVYESLEDAQTATSRLSGRYPNAYARQIAR
jgi:septal ring-binding cell division protein DamX